VPKESTDTGANNISPRRRIAKLRRRLAALQERVWSGADRTRETIWPRNLNDEHEEADQRNQGTREANRE